MPVYFLQPTDGGPVKIGCSEDVEARRKQLESCFGRPLTLLATLPGGRTEERSIHRRFSHLRLSGTEQFKPAIDLMEFIGCPLLIGPNPDAVEAMSCVGRNDGSVVRIDPDLVVKAKYLATAKGVPLSEYLSGMLRPTIEREFKKIGRELMEGGDEE